MRIHLDLLGGIAGDMFIAAMLDAFPELEQGMLAAIDAASPPGSGACRLLPHRDGVLQGRRFAVANPCAQGASEGADGELEHGHDSRHHHHQPDENGGRGGGHQVPHRHVAWSTIRADLEASSLKPSVRGHAVRIFERLASAEAEVHGVRADDVAFHEVGAWDSIADIVGAAYLIDAVAAERWTASAVPLGSGRIRTAHGPMPIPAPATTLLLKGFPLIDDGIGGERVTPTGAALLAYLCPPKRPVAAFGRHAPETLTRVGVGFGTMRLEGISNCVRVLALDEAATAAEVVQAHRRLAVIEFEVDDQSAEDLAMGLEHLRAHPSIFDVVQAPVFGKKGRMMTSVRVLASEPSADAAIEACFKETTTIGLRLHVVSGTGLAREQHAVELDGVTLRVKSVARPGGKTAKTESDDVAAIAGHAARTSFRSRAQTRVLAPEAAAKQAAA